MMLRWQPAQACVLCHEKAASHGFCTACWLDLARLGLPEAVCPQCAEPSIGAAVCGRCQRHAPHYQRVWAGFALSPPLSGCIHAWKYGRQLGLSGSLSALLLSRPPPWLAEHGWDGVLAVPLSEPRLRQRGFNQSHELARKISQQYDLNLFSHQAVQREARPPQSTLHRAERLKNLKNSFRLELDVKNCNLLLIDDVLTTGATLDELARTLKNAGAGMICAWVLAHGHMKKN